MRFHHHHNMMAGDVKKSSALLNRRSFTKRKFQQHSTHYLFPLSLYKTPRVLFIYKGNVCISPTPRITRASHHIIIRVVSLMLVFRCSYIYLLLYIIAIFLLLYFEPRGQ